MGAAVGHAPRASLASRLGVCAVCVVVVESVRLGGRSYL